MKTLKQVIEAYQTTINKIVSEVIDHEVRMKTFWESIPKSEEPQEKILIPFVSEEDIREAALDLCNENDYDGFISGALWCKSKMEGAQ